MQAQPTVFVQRFSDLHNEIERQRRQELRIVIESSHYHIWLTYRALRLHNIVLELYDLSFRLLFYLCFLLALFLELFSAHSQPLFSLVAFFLYYLYEIFLHLNHYRHHRRPHPTPLLTTYSGKTLLKNIVESGLNLSGFLLLFLYSFDLEANQGQSGGFGLSTWMLIIPFTLATLSTVIFTRCPRAGCAHALHLFKASGTVFKFSIFVTFAFSLKQLYSYDWAALLWPYFVSLPLFIVLTFITLVLLLNALVKLCLRRIKCARVLGSLYIFILVAGFLGSSLNGVIFLLKYAATEGTESSLDKYLLSIFIPLFVYLSGVIAFTFLQMKNIAVWFERMLYFDDIYIRSSQGEESEDVQIKSVQFETPHFIRRLTHHYFKKSIIEFRQFYKRAHLRAASVDLTKKTPAGRYSLKATKEEEEDEAWGESQSTESELARVKKKVRTPRWYSAEVRGVQRFTAFQMKSNTPENGAKGGVQRVEDGEEEDGDCQICMSNAADAVLLECGHGGLCYACAVRLLKGTTRACPLCRQEFVKVIQLECNPLHSYEKVLAITFIQQNQEPQETQEQQNESEVVEDARQSLAEDNSLGGDEQESITRFESPAPRLYEQHSQVSEEEVKRYESQRPFSVLMQPVEMETEEQSGVEEQKEEDEEEESAAQGRRQNQTKIKILSVLHHQFASVESSSLSWNQQQQNGEETISPQPIQEMLFNRRTKHLVHSRQEMRESPLKRDITAQLKALYRK